MALRRCDRQGGRPRQHSKTYTIDEVGEACQSVVGDEYGWSNEIDNTTICGFYTITSTDEHGVTTTVEMPINLDNPRDIEHDASRTITAFAVLVDDYESGQSRNTQFTGGAFAEFDDCPLSEHKMLAYRVSQLETRLAALEVKPKRATAKPRATKKKTSS